MKTIFWFIFLNQLLLKESSDVISQIIHRNLFLSMGQPPQLNEDVELIHEI